MRRIAVIVAGVVALLGGAATTAGATSNIVYHTDTNWGRIVDGPSGKNTLVYACDGQNDGYIVVTEVIAIDRRYGTAHPYAVPDSDGPNNGCGSGSTTQDINGYTYASQLRVCEDRPGWYYCTSWYDTNW